MTINLVIAVAKTMPVVFKQRWRHRRIAKARMTARIGRNSPGDVTASCVKSIMVALLGGLRECRRWGRRWVIRCWLGMRASGERKGKQQHCHREHFLHNFSS